MRFIDARTISEVLTYPILIDAIEAAHRRQRIQVQDVMMFAKGDHYFTRHAVDQGACWEATDHEFSWQSRAGDFADCAGGQRAVRWDERGAAGRDGWHRDHLLAYVVRNWHWPADSVPEDVQTLLVGGERAMSRWLVRAHMAVRPSLHRVLVWNRNSDRGQELCEDLLQAGIAATLVQDLSAATSDADIITCCTASQMPLIKGEFLRPGTHLDLVGGYRRPLAARSR